MAVSFLQRSGRIDPPSFAPRQQAANDLYNRSLTPQQPETHWAQGLARVLQSGISGVQNAGLAKDREAFAQSQKQDLSRLAQALSGGDYQSALGELSTPDAQMMALQLAKSDVDRKNMQSQKEKDYTRDRRDKREDMDLMFQQKKQLASLRGRGGGAFNPTREIQSRLMDIQDQKEQLQAQGVQNEDPRMTELSANEENLFNRLNMSKGKVPKKEVTPLNKALGQQEVEGITEYIKTSRKEAEAARKIADESRQVLQMMAANPNLKTGFGREQLTKIQGLINDVSPGSYPDVGDQQAFQKAVGQFTIGGIGKLKESGAGRITQNEVIHIVPTIVPTNTNSTEGVRTIAELNLAFEPSELKAQEAIEWAIKEAQANPNFDFKDAQRRIELSKKAAIEEAGRAFANKRLAQKGERLILNPSYQEGSVIPKYIKVPLNQQ